MTGKFADLSESLSMIVTVFTEYFLVIIEKACIECKCSYYRLENTSRLKRIRNNAVF